ncbi:putative metalloproteinase inhibitor 3 isoform X2 [Apostichopus japonicus]|uniref:Putative metalloproteinase inhibitor 3 isoform X2 n=2 Tax=Stichopus japonicus TaxID=307972 RepID=A0A2G8KZZ1_STIJA|nr:putative metalloproteinase inhibitor 3 isoform X2 [Apostichopus japonicus]
MDNANMQDSRWNITEMVPRSVERDFLTYYVQVERVFKGENAVILNSAGITEIKTPQSASLCGNVELEKGRAYLLSGKVENGTLVIDMCDWVVAYRDMTKKQRQSVRFFFKQNCQLCKITPCFSKQHCEQKDSIPNSCTYDMTNLLSGSTDCEGQHSRCIRSSDGVCRWARSSQMKECIRHRTQMAVGRPRWP